MKRKILSPNSQIKKYKFCLDNTQLQTPPKNPLQKSINFDDLTPFSKKIAKEMIYLNPARKEEIIDDFCRESLKENNPSNMQEVGRQMETIICQSISCPFCNDSLKLFEESQFSSS